MRHTFRYLLASAPVAGQEIALSADDSHHLVRVVRRGAGDEVELVDPEGGRWRAVVVGIGPPATVRVTGCIPARAEAATVALYLGLAEWGRIDIAVEKAVELGVVAVTLFVSERAGRVPGPEAWARRRERLGRVALSAARQSGGAALAEVQGLVPFTEVIAEIPAGEGFLIDPRGDAPLLSALGGRAVPDAPVAVVIGPQAGFSEGELAHARTAGLPACTLGPTTLRTETAAIAAVSIASAAAQTR